MSLSLTVNTHDTASSALAALDSMLTPGQIAASVGEAETALFQNHFRNNGENKKHWPTTGFWPRAAGATSWQATDGGVTISVNQTGVRQRYLGGPIQPKNGRKYLTIPACAEAYGKTARDFSNLKPVPYISNGHLAFALVEADATATKNKSAGRDFAGGGVYFWLVQSVYQAPDSTVLPDKSEIRQTASDAIQSLIGNASGGAK